MLTFGPLSSLFDFATFGLLLAASGLGAKRRLAASLARPLWAERGFGEPPVS